MACESLINLAKTYIYPRSPAPLFSSYLTLDTTKLPSQKQTQDQYQNKLSTKTRYSTKSYTCQHTTPGKKEKDFHQHTNRSESTSNTEYSDDLSISTTPNNNMNANNKAVSNMTTDAPFRFLDLPGELRNIIYKMTLATSDRENPITVTSTGYARSGLLQTCKEVHAE